jgi:hypothetical protein
MTMTKLNDRSVDLGQTCGKVTCYTLGFPAEHVLVMGWPRGVLKTVEFDLPNLNGQSRRYS